VVSDNYGGYTSENGVLYWKDKTGYYGGVYLKQYPAGKTGSFVIPDSVRIIDAWAFYGCTSLTGITIHNGVRQILCDAFRDCTSLKSVTIPNGVSVIKEQAFQGCTSLTSVTIPSTVDSIGYGPFADCTSLTTIDVAERNYGGFYSENGVLYLRDKNDKGENIVCLWQYPAGKRDSTFTIPDNVTYIWHYAFSKCKSLTGVTIPDGVTYIGAEAFAFSGLKTVTIPNSVIGMGSAFGWCSDLTSVTFECMIDASNFVNSNAFPGDLISKYLAGGIGTYTSTM